jgi:hypothetical protein
VKFLKYLVETLIIEGILEQETTEISRSIVNKLKKNINKSKGLKRNFGFTVAAPDSIDVKRVEVFVTKNERIRAPLIQGTFVLYHKNLEKNVIRIMIDAPSSWADIDVFNKSLSNVVAQLKNILRHELEHSQQPREDIFRVNEYDLKNVEDVVKYFLDPAEVSSHVSGMYKEAKLSKRDLSDVFSDYQQNVLNIAKEAGADEAASQELADAVLNVWQRYALKRFPNAIIE